MPDTENTSPKSRSAGARDFRKPGRPPEDFMVTATRFILNHWKIFAWIILVIFAYILGNELQAEKASQQTN
jgi:hypothetical protein